jgi:hypothetical protein
LLGKGWEDVVVHAAIEQLVELGRRSGLEAVIEYPVPGGRIDVVWLWRPPFTIPGMADLLPIVGFEVESSWRTRKHIKGDLINLQDLACAFGVIVLLGDGNDVESTRRFASQLVDRPGSRVVVWSDADLVELAGGSAIDLVAGILQAQRPSWVAPSEHTGKYRPLWSWLKERDEPTVTTTFSEIERVLGFRLPSSSRRHLPHWYGYENTAVGRAIRDAGWRARRVNLEAESVTFERQLASDANGEDIAE